MPPSLGNRLEHILESIESIQSLLAGDGRDAISSSRMIRMALERELEIICEAARYVPQDIRSQESAIDWQRMTDLGNRLRHAYHSIDVAILLHIVNTDLPPLKDVVERVLDAELRKS